MPSPPRLVFLEASKVRSYHSTVMEGFIASYVAQGMDRRWGQPLLRAHSSFYDHLSPGARESVDYEPIPVVDQDVRHLIRKSLLEAWVLLQTMWRAKRDDVIFVTTILPSAMAVVELLRWLAPRRNVVVLQHNELETAFDDNGPKRGSIGHLNLIWHGIRRRFGSPIAIAVLDDFIAAGVRRRFAGSVDPGKLHVVPLPMVASPTHRSLPHGRPSCCFVGFDTPNKGFPTFAQLARELPQLDFLAIGGGNKRNLTTGTELPLTSNEAFLDAIAENDIALFPYTGGYGHSFSAAGIDALSCGLHIIATDRGCFRALADAFGSDSVTICNDVDDMRARLRDDDWLGAVRAKRAERLSRIAQSPYGLSGVGGAIERMFLAYVTPPASRQELRVT